MLCELDSESFSRMCSQIFAVVLLLAGTIKSWTISKRPTTNTKCAISLMLVLLTMFLAALYAVLSKLFPPLSAASIIAGFLGIIFVTILTSSVILGILGLLEYRQKPPGTFTQGRAQAIWAFILSGIFMVSFISGVINATARNSRLGASGPDNPGQVHTFEDVNCRYRSPERPWVKFDPTAFNKASRLGYLQRFPEMYFLLIPERIGGDKNITCNQLAELGKSSMRAASEMFNVLKESSLQIKEAPGILVETETRVKAYHFYYMNWYFATNGYAYQMVSYGRFEHRQKIEKEFGKIASGFELIDPKRVAPTTGPGYTTNFISKNYDYSVNVTNSVWSPYESKSTYMPWAEFGASRGDSCFIVVPVFLGNEKLSNDALAAGLLASMEIEYPQAEFTKHKQIQLGNISGIQFEFSRLIKNELFHYRFKVLQRNDDAFLIAAWTQCEESVGESILSDALERINFNSSSIKLMSVPRTFSEHERKTQGFVFNNSGLFHFNKGEYDKAVALFQAAWNANPSETVYLLNALQSWRRLDRPQDALTFLDCHTNSLSSPKVRVYQAYFQATMSLKDLAITNYANVFAGGYRHETDFNEYISLLHAQKQYDKALEEVQKYLKAGESSTARILEADTFRLQREYTKAIGLLTSLRKKNPKNWQIAGVLAETYIDATQFKEALEVSDEMVKHNNTSAYAYFLKGSSELGLKWYREAKTTFEIASKLAPANKDYRAYLDHISGLLGEGNNSSIKERIEAVVLPSVFTNNPVQDIPEDFAKNYGAYYIRRILALSYVPGKEYKESEYILVHILDASGVAAFSTYQIPFNPMSEQIFVNGVCVMDANGKTVSNGNVTDYYVLDDPTYSSASEKKVLNIPVPGLQPGYYLAITVTHKELGRLEEFPFLAHYFSSAYPVCESIVFLRGNPKELKWRTSPELPSQVTPEGSYWMSRNPIVARWEPNQPAASDFLPTLWLADGKLTWPTIASNYLHSIRESLDLGTAQRENVMKLTGALTNNNAKITAIARQIETNYVYKAIEFGRRARIPNKPADTERNKYGDCKDHSVLFQQYLATVGIPANLALVSHLGPVQKDLPSLDQFNHMIVYIPGRNGGSFVDCTVKGADTANAIPYGLAGREAFILDSGNPRFITISNYPGSASVIESKQDVRVLTNCDAVVEETLTLTGVQAATFREFFLKVPAASQKTILQRHAGQAEINFSELKVEALQNPEMPLKISYKFAVKNAFRQLNGKFLGRLHAGFEKNFLAVEKLDQRLTPFELSLPFTYNSNIKFNVPDGYRFEQDQQSALPIVSRFGNCQTQSHLKGNQLNFEFAFHQTCGKFAAADYRDYQKSMDKVLSLLEHEIILTPKTTTNSPSQLNQQSSSK